VIIQGHSLEGTESMQKPAVWNCCCQWCTQESCSGRGSTNSVEDTRTERTGIWGW